jgi:hypothetical protein
LLFWQRGFSLRRERKTRQSKDIILTRFRLRILNSYTHLLIEQER